MNLHAARVVVSALVIVGGVGIQTSNAQSLKQAQGWPDAAPSKAASKPATPAPPAPTAVAPAKPAAPEAVTLKWSTTEPAAKPEAMKPEAAKPATAAKPAAPAPAPVQPMAVSDTATPVDLIKALQQQSDLLAHLATELTEQRRMVEDQKKLITALEGRAADTAAPAKSPATSPVPAASTPAPVAKATIATPAPPVPVITVETAGAKLKIAGLVQGWYGFNGTGVIDSFRLRRTEIKLTGEVNPRVRWTLMFDPAKSLGVNNTYSTMGGQKIVADTAVTQSSRMLQDAFLAVSYSPAFAVEVGQQKVPLSLEGTQSSGKLDTVERALFLTDKSRGAGYGDQRDLGVIVRGKLFKGQFEYAGGVFDGLGEGQNDIDKNDQKAYAVRAFVKPAAVKGLQIGGSMARGAFRSDDATRRDRQGVEALYTTARFTVKSEFMTGSDGLVSRRGYYGHVAVRPAKSFEFLFRADAWDPDTSSEATAATVRELDYVGGATFFGLAPNTMFQVNFIRKTYAGGVVLPRNVFLLNLQTSW